MVLQSFIINFELSSLKNSFFSSMAQNTDCIDVIEMGRVLVIVLAFLKGSTMYSFFFETNYVQFEMEIKYIIL